MNVLILLFPFFSALLYVITFLLLQQFKNKAYLKNLIYVFFFILFFKLFLLSRFNYLFTFHEVFYILFAFLCNSFIFMNLIQVPISSLQVALLRMIGKNNNISLKNLLRKYNSNIIFEERIKRLTISGILTQDRSNLKIKNDRMLILLKFIKFFRKLHKIKS